MTQWYPATPPAPSPFLLVIGDIGVTATHVTTPSGHAALRGSTWIATDMTVVERRIPTWAIVMAVIFSLFCLLGLLFLLAKENVTRGYVQVWVRSGTLNHVTYVPVTDPAQVTNVRSLVARAQALAVQAPQV